MEHRNHYIAQTVNTASPAHLVTMLYDKLLESVRRVRHEFAADGVVNAEMCHNELVRCQRIVEELRFGLDDERGTLEVGKRADLLVWELDSPVELSYRIGGCPAPRRILGGIDR